MVKNNMIIPKEKPVIEDDLECVLWFKEEGVDSSKIELMAIEEGFRKQDKRHVTIFGGSARDIFKKFSNEKRKEILKEIKNLLESLDWKYEQKEIYKIQRQGYVDNPDILENRQSYICMINMPDMKVFYEKLNSLLKSNIPMQVPHITLFTKGERENPKWYGIGIPSMEEFHRLKPEKIT